MSANRKLYWYKGDESQIQSNYEIIHRNLLVLL